MAKSNKIVYDKTPKTFKEQILLLKARNLTIDNEERAERILTYIGYNRLSDYWYPLLKEPYNQYGKEIIELLKKYPEVDVKHMGFTENWKSQPLWQEIMR